MQLGLYLKKKNLQKVGYRKWPYISASMLIKVYY